MNRAANLAEALRRADPGINVELRPVQFDENLTDLEVDGGDWSLYIVVAPVADSQVVLLDDFRFEDVTVTRSSHPCRIRYVWGRRDSMLAVTMEQTARPAVRNRMDT